MGLKHCGVRAELREMPEKVGRWGLGDHGRWVRGTLGNGQPLQVFEPGGGDESGDCDLSQAWGSFSDSWVGEMSRELTLCRKQGPESKPAVLKGSWREDWM